MGLENFVHPMNPKYLKTLLSASALNTKQMNCIIEAVNKFNMSINNAGKEFESDLEKCLNLPIGIKKESVKKKK